MQPRPILPMKLCQPRKIRHLPRTRAWTLLPRITRRTRRRKRPPSQTKWCRKQFQIQPLSQTVQPRGRVPRVRGRRTLLMGRRRRLTLRWPGTTPRIRRRVSTPRAKRQLWKPRRLQQAPLNLRRRRRRSRWWTRRKWRRRAGSRLWETAIRALRTTKRMRVRMIRSNVMTRRRKGRQQTHTWSPCPKRREMQSMRVQSMRVQSMSKLRGLGKTRARTLRTSTVPAKWRRMLKSMRGRPQSKSPDELLLDVGTFSQEDFGILQTMTTSTM
mmetsp:Transcript_7801/g.14756  ORF Transcript_7801/g.14756 Transcript_7801/m.14756 type:complete len:270 (+) Transcript_7801:372-1181(+)